MHVFSCEQFKVPIPFVAKNMKPPAIRNIFFASRSLPTLPITNRTVYSRLMGSDRESSDGDVSMSGQDWLPFSALKLRSADNVTHAATLPTQEPFDICPGSPLSMEEVTLGNLVPGDGSQVLRPGMVLLKDFIPLADQVKLVGFSRRLGLGEGGFYHPGLVTGLKRHRLIMSLGLDWDPQIRKFNETRHFDGARPSPIPDCFIELTKRAIAAAHDLINADLSEGSSAAVDILPHMHPNVSIINFYKTSAQLSSHQDKTESSESIQKGLPVVSVSLGDSAMFLYGDVRNLTKGDQLLLESGDVLIFGGSTRLIFHGVDSIIQDSAPAALLRATNLRPGRLNLTFRETCWCLYNLYLGGRQK